MPSFLVNIVYVKGTVKTLLPMLNSLIGFSQCEFRLVSNGCNEEEEMLLKTICQTGDRCIFFSLETQDVLDHPIVLNQLLEIETTPHFIFIDSDVVFTKDGFGDWLSELENFDAIFSGLPVWHNLESAKMPEHFRMVEGRYLYDHSDRLIGLSYCAAYKTEKLRSFIKKSEIAFDSCFFHDLPENHRISLKSIQFEKYHYDTGKLLNIFYQMDGARMSYIDSQSILHIGGVSTLVYNNQKGLKRAYNLILDLIPLGLRVLLRTISTSSKVSLKEAKEMERLTMKKKGTRALLLNQLYKTRIGFHDKRHIRLLDKEAVIKVQAIGNVLELRKFDNHKQDIPHNPQLLNTVYKASNIQRFSNDK
ncbi:MAG: hypothetical protein ACI83B_002773 [Sediminicola sp.]|jgi:hypothetical protein